MWCSLDSWWHHEWLRVLARPAYPSTLGPKGLISTICSNLTLFWRGIFKGVWDISPVQPNSTNTHCMEMLSEARTCVKVVKIHMIPFVFKTSQ